VAARAKIHLTAPPREKTYADAHRFGRLVRDRGMTLPRLALGLALCAPALADADPRTHDGFYLRLAVGPGYTFGTLFSAGPDSASTGADVSTQLAIGWTPRPGLVVGAGTFPMVTPSPSYDHVDAGGQHVSATGPFVDYYPDPRTGFHVQGGVLLAAGYLDGGARSGHLGVGYGATAGVGYEWFVGDEWSLGAIARVTAYRLYQVDDSIRLAAPALLFAATWH
jgi:hypothetical protein